MKEPTDKAYIDNVIILEHPQALAKEAAQRFLNLARASINKQGYFTVALSGGSTPKQMYELLSEPPFKDAVNWSKVYIFFGDERFLDPDNTESNYFMAKETLFSKVPIPSDNIFPFRTIDITPEEASKEYEQTLKSFFIGEPKFDLVLLGMGHDGHTASLFPNYPEIKIPPDRFVSTVYNAPKLPPTRLTLTLRIINLAQNIIFLVAGESKANALQRVFSNDETLPAQKVNPAEGHLLWLVDKAAMEK